MEPTGVLFVCLGNICRSPYAEAAFRALAVDRGRQNEFLVASRGTGDWHVGEPPDPRTLAIGKQRGLDLSELRAQTLDRGDFLRFDWILPVDGGVAREVTRRRPPEARARVALLMSFKRGGPPIDDVPDPYYGGPDGFERMANLVDAAVNGLFDQLTTRTAGA
jgi:protein-tyrosine phosphatase